MYLMTCTDNKPLKIVQTNNIMLFIDYLINNQVLDYEDYMIYPISAEGDISISKNYILTLGKKNKLFLNKKLVSREEFYNIIV